MTNAHLAAVLLLLEKMSLTEVEAARVRSAIRVAGSTTVDVDSDSNAADSSTGSETASDTTLAALKELPVTTVVVDGQPRLQKTYHGFAFDVPKPNTSGPFYLVTRGRRVGIFSTSQRTAPHVQGVSLSSHSRVASVDAGLLGMADAIEHKEAELLH